MPTKVCLCHWRLWRGTALTIWKTSSKFLLKSRGKYHQKLTHANMFGPWPTKHFLIVPWIAALINTGCFEKSMSFPGFWLLVLILSNLQGDWCVLQGEWTISIGIHCLKRNHVVLPPIYRKNSSCLLIPIAPYDSYHQFKKFTTTLHQPKKIVANPRSPHILNLQRAMLTIEKKEWTITASPMNLALKAL